MSDTNQPTAEDYAAWEAELDAEREEPDFIVFTPSTLPIDWDYRHVQVMPDLSSGNCAQLHDDTMYPAGRGRQEALEAALSVCEGCPVLQACFDSAVARKERWGVWGGQSFEYWDEPRRQWPSGEHPRPEGKVAPGLTWDKRVGKWYVQVMVDGKRLNGGYFDNPQLAAVKADELRGTKTNG